LKINPSQQGNQVCLTPTPSKEPAEPLNPNSIQSPSDVPNDRTQQIAVPAESPAKQSKQEHQPTVNVALVEKQPGVSKGPFLLLSIKYDTQNKSLGK
jgi:hypothetical protein